jgi:hypothetical protein
MRIVMQMLEVEVAPFILKRRAVAQVDGAGHLTLSACDFDGTPASIFAGVIVNGHKLEKEPFAMVCFWSSTFFFDFALN